MTSAYVALGSNLDDPCAQVERAFTALAGLPQTRLVQRSRLYLTPPWGVTQQPDFVNAAAELDTALAPRALLDALRGIEAAQGRERLPGSRCGPRTLDLDLLLYGDQVIDMQGLQIPHPRLAQRAFVLLPLAEIADAVEVPRMGRVRELLARVDVAGCRLVA